MTSTSEHENPCNRKETMSKQERKARAEELEIRWRTAGPERRTPELTEAIQAEHNYRQACKRRDTALRLALAAGWSRRRLAKELGVTRQAIQQRAGRLSKPE
jgi:hypothetical protein